MKINFKQIIKALSLSLVKVNQVVFCFNKGIQKLN